MSVTSSRAAFPLPLGAPTPRFLRLHLVWPVVAVLTASAVLMGGGGDQWLADHLYRLQGGHWQLKDAWLMQTLLHRGGKWFSTAAALVVMLLYFHHGRFSRDRRLRAGLLYLVFTLAVATASVSVLKSITHMDCPWDLARYGGTHPFIGLLQARPDGLGDGKCFPAGQASAGYGWLGLYFFALLWRPAWRWTGLAVGLAAGLVLGGAQQLRGAHFASHDLWTLMVCWGVALGLYLLVHRRLQATSAAADGART